VNIGLKSGKKTRISQFNAFTLSLAVHAMVILILIGIDDSFVHSDKVLIIDFRMEDAPSTRREPFHAASKIEPEERIVEKKLETIDKVLKDAKEQRSKEEEQKQEIASFTTPEIYKASISKTPSPVLAQGDANIGLNNQGQEFTIHDRSDNVFFGKEGKLKSSSGEKGVIKTYAKVPYGGSGGNLYGQKKAEYLKADFSYIKEIINKNITYPRIARQMAWEGEVIVSFVIASDGMVKNIRVVHSSGKEVLDRNSVETIKKTSPFPKPPVEAQIIIPIQYRLH
jgi:protein TonB